MSEDGIDFLDVNSQDFRDIGKFTQHIQQNVNLSELDGQLSIIGSVSNFEERSTFEQSLESRFEVKETLGDLYLMQSKQRDVPIYLHENDGCPIFLTTGTKTKDIPKTVGNYIRENPEISRMWVGKQQMEEIRRDIAEDDDILIPYFTAHYSPSSNVEGVTRPGFERTIQYYGDDGLESFKALRDKYGVFPTNVQFKKPGVFKFRITQEGVFTINDGGVEPTLSLIQDVIDHLRGVKDAIQSAGYEDVSSDFGSFPKSVPWKIKMQKGLDAQDVEYIDDGLTSDDWEFGISNFDKSTEGKVGFSGEIVDKINYGTMGVRTKDEETIRVFPRKVTGFGQSIRLFSFIQNNIDKSAYAVEA
ncbi:hypothetical protein [Natrinema soli]|uniref:Uncharacterized protein n=1 Tax=Natrinema soli TaxID=1930624 RepID=A0ABD5SET9_9EURY|nr:hypothetical protein [Natrinema soli]